MLWREDLLVAPMNIGGGGGGGVLAPGHDAGAGEGDPSGCWCCA